MSREAVEGADTGRGRRRSPGPRRGLLAYLVVVTALAGWFLWLDDQRSFRVGDGSEYYAMSIAWSETGRPWMSPGSFDAYDRFVDHGDVRALVSRNILELPSGTLRIGETQDFNHFWFYSFLASALARVLQLLGVGAPAHPAFLLLHLGLLLLTVSLAYRYQRTGGLLAFALTFLTSPVFWYFDKVHTELFTVALTTCSVVFVVARAPLPAALCLALASTQNPSFAIVMLLPLGFGLVRTRPLRAGGVALAIATVVVAALHPAYYLWRHGGPTPQLITGAASPGVSLPTAYVWLLDPDLGLLPNWPTGALVLAGALWLWVLRRRDGDRQADRSVATNRGFLVSFLSVLFLVNVLAHASTPNLNSGATPGPSRYALWYVPLFYPLVLFVWSELPKRRRTAFAFLSILGLCAVYELVHNDPRRPTHHTTPTRASRLVQTHAPWLYDPPPEIFYERYSGRGEGFPTSSLRGVVGPDCRKVYLHPGASRRGFAIPEHCRLDPRELSREVEAEIPRNEGRYVRVRP